MGSITEFGYCVDNVYDCDRSGLSENIDYWSH